MERIRKEQACLEKKRYDEKFPPDREINF